MSVHERQRPPSGHGEVLCTPSFSEWPKIARRNAEAIGAWPSELRELRDAARAESVGLARSFSASIGVHGERTTSGLVVMTGHQPELYHPGVWVKDFLVQRFSEETGALGIDVVVDTDAANAVELRVPRLAPAPVVCSIALTPSRPERAYVQVPVPDAGARARFRADGLEALANSSTPALVRHLAAFCDALDASAVTASDASALVVAARRAYEQPVGTDYLELPISRQATTDGFRRFAARLLLDAARFREVMNAELAAYRDRTGTRSLAQPFPDLGVADGRIEVPFWLLDSRGRTPVTVSQDHMLFAGDVPVLELGDDPEQLVAALDRAGVLLGPKALTLTLFERLFVCDLFVHGIGGGRYDRVTDAVIRSYFGVEPPAYVVASMTLFLPLGGRITTDDDVAAAEQLLQRFEHNPDQLLGEIEFDTVAERHEAERLAAEKARLVALISEVGADRKALGREIRAANASLGRLLEPIGVDLRDEVAQLRAARDASAVLTDRTYSFCLWDPREVMDKVR